MENYECKYNPYFLIKNINEVKYTTKPTVKNLSSNYKFKLINTENGVSIDKNTGILFFSEKIPIGKYKFNIKITDNIKKINIYLKFYLIVLVDDSKFKKINNKNIDDNNEILSTDYCDIPQSDNGILSTDNYSIKKKNNKLKTNNIKNKNLNLFDFLSNIKNKDNIITNYKNKFNKKSLLENNNTNLYVKNKFKKNNKNLLFSNSYTNKIVDNITDKITDVTEKVIEQQSKIKKYTHGINIFMISLIFFNISKKIYDNKKYIIN